MAKSTEIELLLRDAAAVIAYVPLRTEVPWREIMPVQAIRVYEIPPRASLDPAVEARTARKFAESDDVVLFIPGRQFDANGTRLGQGGGWYDRFLTRVPREWLRIGFCYDDQFSKVPLRREAHDQPMDYVVVVDRATGVTRLYSSEGLHD